MPYQKSYIKQEWKNLPEEETPISAEALLHIEEGISELDDRIVEIGNQEEKDPTVPDYVKNIKVGDIDNWNSKSEFSGYYGDLKEKPIIPQADGTTIKMSAYGVLSVEGNSEGAHTEGYNTTASGEFSHAEGSDTKASGRSSHAEGGGTMASGESAHAEGSMTEASNPFSHAEGRMTKAKKVASHAEGAETTADGENSHAEGECTTASGKSSHAEGYYTESKSSFSHTEGMYSEASGTAAHAEGNHTIASGEFSHAEGIFATTGASGSHAEGLRTVASSEAQHVQGKYNVEDANGIYAHIVGGGTKEDDRKNIHTLDWAGNAMFAGDVVNGNGISLNSLSLLAQGGSSAIVFDTQEKMNTWLAVNSNTANLSIGQVFLIRALDTPDYWWDGTAAVELEGRRIDLSGYALAGDLPGISTIDTCGIGKPDGTTITIDPDGTYHAVLGAADRKELYAYIDQKFSELTSDILGGES